MSNVKCQPQYPHDGFTIKMLEGKFLATARVRQRNRRPGPLSLVLCLQYIAYNTTLSTSPQSSVLTLPTDYQLNYPGCLQRLGSPSSTSDHILKVKSGEALGSELSGFLMKRIYPTVGTIDYCNNLDVFHHMMNDRLHF